MKSHDKPKRAKPDREQTSPIEIVPYSRDEHLRTVAGIVYWKGQNTSLQGTQADFLSVVHAIRTRTLYKQKWCTAMYDTEGKVFRLGPGVCAYDDAYTVVTLPLAVADHFADVLEHAAKEMVHVRA